MSRYPARGLERVRNSRAYQRMKEANPDEFEPKTICFATYPDAGKSTDWQNCLPLKAAFVYHAITGQHVDVETQGKAHKLLVDIAEACRSPIKNADEQVPRPPSPGLMLKEEYRSPSLEPKPGKPQQPAAPRLSPDDISPDAQPPRSEPPRPEIPFLIPSPTPLRAREKGGPNQPDQTSMSDDDCALVDGIFLVVGFLSELKEGKREDADSRYLMTHSEEIVKDIIKIENQLSLGLIKNIVNNVETAIKNHPEGNTNYKLSFGEDKLANLIRRFCWYYSPVHQTERKTPGNDVLDRMENLLQCLHSSLKGGKPEEKASGGVWRSPSARQLKRCGVRFKDSSDGTLDVKFSEPTLTMPALVHDFRLETVVRNLLAWECLPEEKQKPVTRCLQFMSGLVGDLGDVRVLKKFGLIKGRWKNFREVLDLVKRIDGSATYPSVYMALDKEANALWEYHDARMKSFFVRNRPAVLWFSSVAAASVIATAIYASRRRRTG